MRNQKRLALLLVIGLISLFAIRTMLAQDNNGHGHGNGRPAVQPTQNGNNGNHQGGGNNGNGNGNGGNQNNTNQPAQVPIENTAVSTTVPQESTTTQLGCQKNNPSRLDCSSLEVKGVCDGSAAVFIIHNTGEPGNGDMLAATQYRVLVDGVVIQVGSVQLAGGASGQVTYSGGGTVTIEVDQQVGHPGNSHPRVTLDCGPASTETAEPTEEFTPTPTPTET